MLSQYTQNVGIFDETEWNNFSQNELKDKADLNISSCVSKRRHMWHT